MGMIQISELSFFTIGEDMDQLFDNFNIEKFEQKFGYHFKNPILLCEALTHTSFANEYYQKTGKQIPQNERLEFLGDTVMGTLISTQIFKRFPEFPEGKLSKLRSAIVCEASLAACFTRNQLTEFLVLGRGEEMTGGRERPSILADCFEAIIGAIYLDGGFDAVSSYIQRTMGETIENGIRTYDLTDAKTMLQEVVRKIGSYVPVYKVVKAEGPDHNRVFTVQVSVTLSGNENPEPRLLSITGEGTGSSKKDAEQKAATDFISKGDFSK